MKWTFLVVLFVSESCTVTGQILFKYAMGGPSVLLRRSLGIAAGVVAMTAGFFLWLQLLGHYDLSFLFPFEGFDRILLVLSAILFLRERVTPQIWLGIVLISCGITIVACSR